MGEIYTLTIYTQGGAIDYQISATTPNFKDDLITALEGGCVTVDTLEGGTLLINPLQAVAIEINETTPPVEE